MNGYNFTERVRKVLMRAREQAIALRHEYVGTEHLLLGVGEGGGVAEAALTNLGIDLNLLREEVLKVVKPGPADSTVSAAAASGGLLGAIADTIGLRHDRDLPYTSRAKKVLELAMREARDLNHSYVGTEHLLIGLMREERGIAAQVLTSMGSAANGVRDEVIRLLGTELPAGDQAVASEKPPTARRPDMEAAITLVVEHPDGRIEARKFRRAGDAVSFLKSMEL